MKENAFFKYNVRYLSKFSSRVNRMPSTMWPSLAQTAKACTLTMRVNHLICLYSFFLFCWSVDPLCFARVCSSIPTGSMRRRGAEPTSCNAVSAKRSPELIDDAYNFFGVASRAARAGKRTTSTGQESRDLRAKVLKSSQWCKAYWAQIRVCSDRNSVAFWLPHEIIACIAEFSDLDKFLETAGMDPSSLLRNARQKWVSRCWAWGDGIPVNWDRTESIETIALSFPGLKSSHASCRIIEEAVLRGNVDRGACGMRPLDAIPWVVMAPMRGRWAVARATGFEPNKAGTSLGFKGIVAEMRGDWECVRLPPLEHKERLLLEMQDDSLSGHIPKP